MNGILDFCADDIIKRALAEDINYVDVTTDFLIPDEQEIDAELIAKESGVLCGIDIALRVFDFTGGGVTVTSKAKDGDKISYGDVICVLKGKTKSILKGERTALNLLQHLSGIATMTNKCAELIKWTNAEVADTRKTLPGLRALQKYAVMTGGGKNHRFSLSDGVLLKDNHIDAAGGITPALKTLKKKLGHMVKIEVEVRNLAEFNEALNAGADIILLDNMSCEELTHAVNLAEGRIIIEASGNITLDNMYDYAKTGINIISMGCLTHSVKALDISLIIMHGE